MRRGISVVALSLATFVVAPGSATAATEIGNTCTATILLAPTVIITGEDASNPLPIAAPGDGVVTKYRVTLPAIPGTIPQKLKVARTTPVAGDLLTVAESTETGFPGGTTSADTRIPIKAGDLIGLGGSTGALACSAPPAANTIGTNATDTAPGTTATFAPVPSASAPVVATIEPDADGDGFGDETQDKCPQSAKIQSECPVVILDSFPVPGKSSLTVLVATSSSAPVAVSGSVKVKKVPKTSGKARATKTIKLDGGSQTLEPGTIGRYTIAYPKTLKKAIAALSRRKSATATLTATGTDVAGRVSTDTITAKLPGRAK